MKSMMYCKYAGAIGLGLMAAVLFCDELSTPLEYIINNAKETVNVDRRELSINLGGGNCLYAGPEPVVPESIDFHKTIIAGFPSSDKRMVYQQMEALTGYPAKSEWDFKYVGMSNHPFIKVNYPHHEGIWAWGNVADQVVLLITNLRKSIVEYHDIEWDLEYPNDWYESEAHKMQLYIGRPPEAMEQGLMRNVANHQLSVPWKWRRSTFRPNKHQRKNPVKYYDPHCTNGDVTSGCEPVAVLSADKLLDPTQGPLETARIANILLTDSRTGQYVIASEAWNCIWEEMIQNHKGLKVTADRPNYDLYDYNFSSEMLDAMIAELDRLISKYGSPQYVVKPTANRIVELLVEHRAALQVELSEVNTGVRMLSERDFLGLETREKMEQDFQRVDSSEEPNDSAESTEMLN
ncbi:hypothetical protein ACHAWU_001391 [Discostella pseudostelligera]|uniref:Uncharacterized protein n=1 Tax=Discostella pseudostelligera TaxID=259834 RepID=A0ABD3M1X8_9STRA